MPCASGRSQCRKGRCDPPNVARNLLDPVLMATQTLVLVFAATAVGLAVVGLLFRPRHATPAVVQPRQDVPNDDRVFDTWENEGGNAE